MSLARHASSILLTNTVTEGLQFLLKIIVAGLLGPQTFGVYTLLQLLPQYAEKFFRFGVDDGVTYLAGRARERAGLFFFNALIILFVASLASMILIWSAHSSFVNWVLKGSHVSLLTIGVTLLQIPSVFLIRASTKRLMFLEDIKAYNLWTYGPPLLAAVGVALVAAFSPTNLFLIMAIVTLAMALGATGSARAVYRLEPMQCHLDKKVVWELLHYGRRLYVPGIMNYMQFRADVLLLGLFLNPKEVGIYALAAVLAQIVFRLASVVASLLYAKASKESEEYSLVMALNACRYTLLCSAIISIPVLLAVEVGVTFFMPAYLSMLVPFYWLLPAWLIVGTGHVLQHYYYGIGQPSVPTRAISTAAIINIVLNVVLIPHIGITGAAISSFVSYLLYSTWLVIAFLRKNKTSLQELILPRKSDFKILIQSLRSIRRPAIEGKAA
ncbi:MAG: hypothetical protein COV45_05320 [Deltaproteobacteria bacterium CG11_big_fil_rev_8_21_14_0_20_47_16]|nr:MAG: hypothetical protein COV45_05320 [Deltaproteobacteria bacterium CG11_big_fil_rev_8_21_14_0_20_47_16]